MRPLSIVHTENSCGWGGQEIRILTESRGFLDRGHRVTLLAPPEAPIVAAAQRLRVPVIPLPLRKKRLSDLRALRQWLVAHRADVDILNTHSSTDSWLGAIACATMRDPPPIVRTRHLSTTVHNRIGTRWLYVRANAHIVTTGEAVKRKLARENRIPLERMTSIPTGIDLARYVPGDPHSARARLGLPDRPTLGIVATLRDWKGHVYLFDAIAGDRAAWADWQILVVGDGPDRALLEAHVARAGLVDLVRFAGQQDDVVPWLQALDLFTLPSYSEEGVPHDAGVTGLSVAPRSAEALAAGLARLRDDAALRARFGRAARARAVRDFGIEPMLDRMEAVFRSVLEPGPFDAPERTSAVRPRS